MLFIGNKEEADDRKVRMIFIRKLMVLCTEGKGGAPAMAALFPFF